MMFKICEFWKILKADFQPAMTEVFSDAQSFHCIFNIFCNKQTSRRRSRWKVYYKEKQTTPRQRKPQVVIYLLIILKCECCFLFNSLLWALDREAVRRYEELSEIFSDKDNYSQSRELLKEVSYSQNGGRDSQRKCDMLYIFKSYEREITPT